MKPSFSLKWLFVIIAVVALIVAGLLNANSYWQAVIVLPTCLTLAYSALEWAIRKKPWSIGFAVGGWSYVSVLRLCRGDAREFVE